MKSLQSIFGNHCERIRDKKLQPKEDRGTLQIIAFVHHRTRTRQVRLDPGDDGGAEQKPWR